MAIRTARKAYPCSYCKGTINPGDTYEYIPNTFYYQSTGKRYRNVYQEVKYHDDAKHICANCAGI